MSILSNAQDIPNAQDIAQKSADIMWSEDNASAALGMTIQSIGPGEATLSMRVRDDMTNGHGSCHGGYIFLLADSAFAFACNSRNQRCVAQHCTISYLAPGKKGALLTAIAREKQRAERSGIYDVAVIDETGATIAEFRGHSRVVPGVFF